MLYALSTRSITGGLAATGCLCATIPIAAAVPQSVSSPRNADASVSTVALPGLPAGASEPQVALDDRGSLYIAYGAGNVLYCSVSRTGGASYAVPVRIGQAGILSLEMRRGPRIAVSGKFVVVSAVYAQQGKGRDGELLAWRSGDGGKTWQGPARVNDTPAAAREGLHAMAASADGKTVACTWLDLRGKGTQIYLSLSRDGGATWSKNTRVYTSPDGTVCECCHPSLSWGPKGELFVMWRNWLNGSRDMFITRSGDGGTSFLPARKLGGGTWPLNACPMDGGSLTVAPNGTVTTIWRRDKYLFACEPGGTETLVGRGQQGWNAATTRGLYAVWLWGRPGQLMTRLPGEKIARVIAEGANDPVVATTPSGRGAVVVAWGEGPSAQSRIRSAVLSTPKLNNQ